MYTTDSAVTGLRPSRDPTVGEAVIGLYSQQGSVRRLASWTNNGNENKMLHPYCVTHRHTYYKLQMNHDITHKVGSIELTKALGWWHHISLSINANFAQDAPPGLGEIFKIKQMLHLSSTQSKPPYDP